MPDSRPKEIVYLLGAGATHAELVNRFPLWFVGVDENDPKKLKRSLLLREVSLRICKEAKSKKWFIRWKHIKDFEDIELFLSLIEENRIKYDQTVKNLQKLLKKDITSRLKEKRQKDFCLHGALFQLHQEIGEKEKIKAIISLNYDDVLDKAYRIVYGKPKYYHSNKTSDCYILKLHGGFSYKDGDKTVPIIPLGTHKNYLQLPYNFIWGRALESLRDCSILRVVGCSLSANDVGLIDLIFKAHLAREKQNIEIQIIDFPEHGNKIKKRFGFFPGIKTLTEIKEPGYKDYLVSESDIKRDSNPFKTWLKKRVGILIPDNDIINKKKFLKKLIY